MFQISRSQALCFLSLFASALGVRAQEPLPVNGVTDRGDYADSITFNVPTTSGYTYSAKLDGHPVPVEVNVVVNQVDYHQLFVSRTNIATLEVTNRLIG